MFQVNIDDYLIGYFFLGSGKNNQCFYNDHSVVKVFFDLDVANKEATQMIAANKVNSLAVRFHSLETIDDVHFLFMEKIKALTQQEIDLFSISDRKVMANLAADQLLELHEQFIYHMDIKTPSATFDNILISSDGIRLIDWGRSCEYTSGESKEAYGKDWNSWCDFTKYFYNL